jgi:glucose/mannose transport system substrate-binding protein
MNCRRIHPLLIAVLLLTATAGAARGADKPVEFQHFWQSPSEKAALDVLRRSYAARGGQWVEMLVDGSVAHRELAIRRIMQGTPPFAMQWFAGKYLLAMAEAGVIYDLDGLALEQNWGARLHPTTMQHIAVNGSVYGVPVGIHTQNWAWFNNRLLKRYTDKVPEDWESILTLLERATADGTGGIAIGEGNWERGHLFSAILISEGGDHLYRRLLQDGDLSVLDAPEVRTSIDLFGRLREFALPDSEVRTWDQATAALAEGEALVQFMGDWVLPELTRRGFREGVDFECVLSPGRLKRQLTVVDIVVFPHDELDGAGDDHFKMVDALLDEHAQVDYSAAKGSIPVLGHLADELTDPCIRKSFQLFNSDRSVPSPVMIFDERVAGVVEETISAFWNGRIATADQVVAEIRRLALPERNDRAN